jgi:hypothetical protein
MQKRICVIRGVHYFDAHRLDPQLLAAPELQLNPRVENMAGPDGAGDTVVTRPPRMKFPRQVRMRTHQCPQMKNRGATPCQIKFVTQLRKN